MNESHNLVTGLICNSNMFVPCVLTEVLKHPKENFLLMSDLPNTVRFLKELKLQNVDVFHYKQPSSRTRIFRARRNLINQTNIYKFEKIVFFHAEFGGIINWFLKFMSKETLIYYCKVYNSLPYPKAHGFKALKFQINEWFFSGVRMDILVETPRLVPSLPKKFYDVISAQPYNIEPNYRLINKQVANFVGSEVYNKNIVFLTGATVKLGFVKEEEYTTKINALIESIGINNCIAKCHPSFNDVFGLENELSEIPSYIPGNLIIGNYEIFLSNHSTMLVEAALAGKMAISLLDYYDQDSKQKSALKTFLDDRLQGRATIYYPTCVEEIKYLISSRMNV